MKYFVIAISVIIVGVISFATVKKVSPVSWGLWGTTNTSSGIALHGYDPVSYFEDGAAVQGQESFTVEWRDAVWQFSSADNKERFAASPDQFAPQFGGFCAFAVSKGFTADPAPDAWHIEGERLYVFADKDVRDEWVATLPDGSLERSRENWAKR
jgi:hypothetical protein